MKPTSRGKIATEARTVYNKVIEVFFDFASIEELDEIIHPDFLGYGTAAHEFFKDGEAVKGMAKLQAEQLKGTKFKLTRKPVIEKLLSDGSAFLILEDFELYIEDNDHNLPLRLSTILEKVSDRWVITHFHGSTPDSDIAEEEAFPMEGLRKKNEELEAKIRERTRELEIEAALERVRVASMSMQHTHEVSEVVKVLFDQLKVLNLDFIQTWISIFYLDQEYLDVWFSRFEGLNDEPICISFPASLFEETSLKSWRAGSDVNYVSFESRDEIEEFMKVCSEAAKTDYFLRIMDSLQTDTLEFIEANNKYGTLCKSGKSKPTEEEEMILKRFAKVFEQTYTRFLDLKKAEAQAREAQINLAVERVRAKALAMHRSEEIMEVVATLKNEVMSLEIPDVIAATIFLEAEENKVRMWDLSSLEKDNNDYEVPFDITFKLKKRDPHLYVKRVWENQEDYFFEEQDHKDFTRIIAWLREQDKGEIADEVKAFIEETQLSRLHHAVKRLNNGKLAIDLLNAPPEEMKTILTKMGAAFDLAYRRFEDLKKAEAQARESQIQLSLERIRARTMAMQTTDELTDVLSLLFKQFDILGIDPAFAHLTLFNEADDTFSFRITGTSGQRLIAEQIIDMASYPAWYDSYEKWKKGDPGIVDCIDYPPEVVPAVFEIMKPIFSKLPPDSKIKAENFPQGIYTTQGHCQFGYIGFNHSRRATEEEKEIVRKFAIEFGRLYQRFLDLKQAESQAREAQIEASLERVRSASMAIHKSEELHKVVLTVLQEINSLGLNIDAAHLFRFEEGDDKGLNMWIAGDGGMYPYEIYFPYIKHEIFDGIYEARKKNKNFFAIPRMSKKEKDRVYRHLLKNTKIEIPEGRQNYALKAKSAVYSVALAKHSGIALLQFSEDNTGFSADENEILRRFSNVFEQAYIRFLGLAKAEKQAREAMIEASLERIRSRSMAMHASDELNDVLSVMFGQIELLGIDAKSAHLTLMDIDNNKFSFRITGKSGAANIGEQIIDLDAMPTWKETVENWKKAKPHSHQCLVYPPEILPDLWNLIDESLKKLPVKERIRIKDFPNGVFDCEGHTKFGYIGFNNSRPPTEEEISIVIRFAREFERVYQRFLDIEKAENQAREAQIEAALERVRSQSLAMHNTSEMQLVANAVFEQLQALGMEMDVVGMSGVIEAKQDYDVWIGGAPLGSALRIPYNEDTQVQRDYNKMLKDRPELFARTYSGQVKKEYIDRLLTHGEFPKALKKKMETSDAFTTLIAPKKNSGIQVVRYSDQPYTDQDAEILKRFAGVFEQAYIRFMDLERAEAQAREAQIEASLERIRAKAMAMHASSELNEVLSVLFEQFNTLGINPVWAHLSLINLEENTFTYRMSRADKNNRLSGQVVDLDARPEWQDAVKAFKTSKPNSVSCLEFPKEVLPQIWELFEESFSSISEEYPVRMEDFPNGIFNTQGYCKFGYIGFNHNRPPTEEEKEIVVRIANEFGRVYQRFLDLQKAEAQAREAQIEASLERVRARAMAMHHSEELQDMLSVLFQQYDVLGIKPVNVFLTLFDLPNNRFVYRTSGKGGARAIGQQTVDFSATDIWMDVVHRFKEQRSEDIELIHYPVESLPDIFEILKEAITSVPEEHQIKPEDFPDGIYTTHGTNEYGFLGVNHTRPCTEKENEIIVRFSREFGRIYRRFLDLQKAEAQAREAQIEAALERVRARTMAMHNTEDIAATVTTFFNELMGLHPDSSIRCGIGILSQSEHMELWTASVKDDSETVLHSGTLDMSLHPLLEGVKKTWERKAKTFSYELIGTEVKKYFNILNRAPDYPVHFDLDALPKSVYHNSFVFKDGTLFVFTEAPLKDEIRSVVVRFAAVFGQTYTRYLDLQKAEAQARESQIQLALERVRARSLAMQSSDELHEVLGVLFRQFDDLGIQPVNVFLSLFDREKRTLTYRASGKSGKRIPGKQVVEVDSMEALRALYDKWLTDNSDAVEMIFYPREVLPQLFGIFSETFSSMPKADRMGPEDFPEGGYSIAGYTPFGYLGYDHQRKATEEEQQILSRFCTEFTRVYQRFLDLQKVEAQAREARIEAALEKVRSQSLAMHTTGEMQEVANAIYEQLHALGLDMEAVGMSGAIEAREDYDVWVGGVPFGKALRIPYNEQTKIQRDYNKAIKDRPELFARTYTGKVKEEYINHLLTHGSFPAALKKKMKTSKAFSTSIAFARNSSIQILRYTNQPYSEEDNEILKRFSRVFEQAYIRFRDLERAEAQAREAQIEASLERVRARAMGMQKSEELSDVLAVLFQQFDVLGIRPINVWLSLYNAEDRTFTYRATGTSGKRIHKHQVIDLDAMDIWKESVEQWEKGTAEAVIVTHYPPEILPQLMEVFAETFSAMPEEERIKAEDLPQGGYNVQGYCKFGFIGFNHIRVPTEEEKEILKKFATEFERLYQRFIDIEKAEVQAREAQIESALERVRSRSLAMQKPDELQEVVAVVAEELKKLGVVLDVGGVVLCTYFDDSKDVIHWTASEDPKHPSVPFFLPYFEDTLFDEAWESKLRGDTYFAKDFSFEVKNAWFKKAFEISDYRNLPDEYKKQLLDSKSHGLAFAWAKNSAIMVPSLEGNLPSEAEKEILLRFARVFEQAYIRFMDLQKSEEQAREAKIEMALEKVRARTMAMHKSEELGEVAAVLFEQISALTYAPERFNIAIGNREEAFFDIWVTDQKGHEVSKRFMFQVDKSPVVKEVFNAWGKERFIVQDLHGKKLQEWVRYMEEEIGLPFDKARLSEHRYINSVFFSHGCIGITTNEPPETETLELIERFAKVFQQTYVRFLDLQKAEAQAREAQIEVALERVRSRAMAMHQSDELTEELGVLFDQFDFLGINPVLTHLTLMDEENETFTLRISRGGNERTIAEQRIDINAVESWKQSFENWKRSDLHAVDCIDYSPEILPYVWELMDEVMSALPEDQKIRPSDFPDGLYTTQGHCKYGYIGINQTRKATQEEKEIVIRFAKEFGRLYQRFLDLQQAEERAREALKQASLDRVRGQIASMRSTEDLERITPLIWNELTALGVPFIRCGVFIVDESSRTVQAFLSAPDGRSLGAMKIPFDADKDTAATVAHWKKGEVYRTHWDKGQFLAFMATMMDLGQVRDNREYQGAEQPPDSLFLHFLPFTQGMLYVGNTVSLDQEQMEAVGSLADAFAIAYARYEDFAKLEKTKKQVEKTLNELRATQNQLVQSEKMASLGELTAGIAHEIQNPLNFVNNFSEVSVELMEEMEEEMNKGDLEEVKAIMEDIKQNLDKIHHHGKRADGIVKGMLQHSRASSGEKELTDLNILADEYLRLAYHGLRAKDKSFNATLETQFDESLGKIRVVPQEIGRVILNLITNAFHVVKEKKEKAGEGFMPTVTVTTRKNVKGVEIAVKDNGNGIPEAIRDKIFQPFFTTKPTGQGTGLGLSMSYDIVTKGHGGSLEVDTTQGVGTVFTICLPTETKNDKP
ncbi:His Kinase A (phospho-acceptor) domain-containing protein [Muriicola jejuensis]|uniref:histidine kinase n=1 Tax=Muriicola jejuensis TaxID=504488 RepID=A0A6P0UHS7_9FLAO|nr:ATP-binding protein [Muriicola jejuensis]NER09706.1 hypothetical protein [Muriicola jejuensis]SMP06347.1 His Kinase A (phospho-acceptor) domain-containing protein [Muriicola jejuensis]